MYFIVGELNCICEIRTTYHERVQYRLNAIFVLFFMDWQNKLKWFKVLQSGSKFEMRVSRDFRKEEKLPTVIFINESNSNMENK